MNQYLSEEELEELILEEENASNNDVFDDFQLKNIKIILNYVKMYSIMPPPTSRIKNVTLLSIALFT